MNTMNRRTLERYLRIDILRLKRDYEKYRVITQKIPYLLYQYHGKNAENVRVYVFFDWSNHQIELNNQQVNLTTTLCNYGGCRWWYVCPCCGYRCRVLYFNEVWQCRRCLNLVYQSSQITKTDYWYHYRQAERIACQLDSNYHADGFEYLFSKANDLFPLKPKYMKQVTYKRLYARFSDWVRRGNVYNHQELNRVLNQF